MSKSKKDAKRILEKLRFEPAKLSTNKGRGISDPICRRLTDKDRRHSGHRIYFAEDEDYPVMLDTYDDWRNHRDGSRDKSKVIKNIYPSQFCHTHKWICNTEFDEEDYWEHRRERDKIRKKEKIRKLMKIQSSS